MFLILFDRVFDTYHPCSLILADNVPIGFVLMIDHESQDFSLTKKRSQILKTENGCNFVAADTVNIVLILEESSS